ncbi:MAG: hypothetical protein MJ003_03275 [Paludibacteraceae bacterium]|nr:hypothetical protein [Paludibacteraceae bacterium]
MDIIANANKIKAFAKVGRTLPFETDNILGFTSLPVRTVESVDAALALIQSDEDKSKYSIFWFNKSGIDFGTTDLINENIKSAGAKFMSAIESNDIASIQDVIGDKAKSISSSKLLSCYIDVMNENGYSEEAIAGCLDTATSEQHISIISALHKSGILDELKKKTVSISDISVDKTPSNITLINRIINDVNQLIVGKNISSDIALSGAYDQFCKLVRSKVISISNNASDNIGKTEKTAFVALLKSCLETLKSIDTSYASTRTASKFKEDIDTISKSINDVDETYLLVIASNEEICWFCGGKASDSFEKKYERSKEYPIGYNTKRVITYTKSAKFYVCKKCMRYHNLESLFIVIGVILFFVAELLLIKCFNDDWGDAIGITFIIQFFLWAITIYGGKALGVYIHSIAWSKSHIRKESDHPIVKRIKSEGFS